MYTCEEHFLLDRVYMVFYLDCFYSMRNYTRYFNLHGENYV